MKLAYVTEYDARKINGWSGTGYFIANAFKDQSLPLEYIGPLKQGLAGWGVRTYKRHYYECFNEKYLRDPEPLVLKEYAKQVAKKLSRTNVDIVFSATVNPIAYLDCDKPIVFWADATFAGLQNFYPHYSNLCNETVQDWHRMEQLALQNCKLAIYSSDWAAQTAIDSYSADPTKVKVVPFGANVEQSRSIHDIKDSIENRPRTHCKLLFLGVDWHRKGGDVAFKVAKMLNESGLKTELISVGCQPALEEPMPSYVKFLGFISKSTSEGKAKITQLIANSHFLILPSLADCTPIVFGEANSMGVPCISTKIGGIPTTIRDNINGKLFDTKAGIVQYCDYISNLFYNYEDYKQLALSSFNEYNVRLNWSVAGKTVKSLLESL